MVTTRTKTGMDREQVSFERGPVLDSVAATLPATIYNLTRILLAAHPEGCLFVPIRSLQYLAVVDKEEIIFIDSLYRRWVMIAWRDFRPGERRALDEAVAYRALFHTPDGVTTQRRLLGDFHAALELLSKRGRPAAPAKLLSFSRD